MNNFNDLLLGGINEKTKMAKYKQHKKIYSQKKCKI